MSTRSHAATAKLRARIKRGPAPPASGADRAGSAAPHSAHAARPKTRAVPASEIPMPLPEELLERTISFLEGPLTRFGERVLSSRIVLLPASLALDLSLRGLARAMGRNRKSTRGAT